MATTSYGSITIVDITDVGEFSVYPQANKAQTQIYNPDESNATAYSPNWAENNNVSYDLNYENSDSVKKDDIIKCSHQTGQTIKKDDTVIVTISRGKIISIPNFVGMSKSDIQNKIRSLWNMIFC